MNCPFCSAPVKPNWPSYRPEPKDGISWFTCGTMIHDAKPSRGDQTRLCVENEVASLKARVARLEEAGDECARYSTTQASDDWHAAKEAKP